MRQFVLIGGGHASASVARALRRQGFDGNIVIVGDEELAPYQRPPLSKDFLAGEADIEDIWSVEPDWYGENGVELKLGTAATHIDVETRQVTLSDGTKLDAEAVLIATGVSPRKLEGVTSDRVFYLKTAADAQAIKAALKPGAHLIVVGGGFIGLEIAATARKAGAEVTVLEAGSMPLARVLGDEVGGYVSALHESEGVTIRCGVAVEGIEDRGEGVVVRTQGGEEIEGSLVVVGIGTTPNDQIARASEITVGNGIRVDEYGRTSAHNVFAAGDVANHQHMLFGRRMRIEHFDNATRQALVIATNMLGGRAEFNDVPWFWSDQYDFNLQFAGSSADYDTIVLRGDVEDNDFSAFYLKDGVVVGVFGFDRGGDVMHSKTLIAEKRVVDPALLADDDLDLAELVMGAPEEEDEEESGDVAEASSEDESFKRVARSGQVTEGMARRFALDGIEVAIARSGGQIYAIHNLCTHLACHLASGKVEGKGITCLCHGSIFDLETGVPINPPATRPVRTFPVKEEGGQIYIKMD
ncbi:FAD-dependent oxidoreductase [Erythrobacter sp. SG61-1L]|uniref:FAD-dependent oxidoreductase n=1 Tax=Erythrobacter sp. SG61-1L TaxID=1603897 RepID=UPI0009EA3E74|nr:FAD-dependent oxidoreductase [Erythrobacter sp. SG61-1L]